MADKSVRIDKWLWAVRIFKTRSLATDACKSGKVEINSIKVKASREVKEGEIINLRIGPLNKTIKVTGILENRLSAKLVLPFMEDLTPEEEYKKLQMMRETNYVSRDRGAGRPTKRERRDIDKSFPDW